ncbi:phosphate ABC transporter substrate-binding protein PstS [Ornithinicoccus hortensis]|uniref:Phosphate-binding protein n=1 Tax=Ornithinicoccus hortensis TaxID=82346 RepID=A0A542YNX7_9MICO|nr:phosphate ABC transporter substrate-binding protein PstS [Ornithinicoccus hortensis]TQL49813.1 phosphate ABC transporter substrate-binding protein (PhoT family) [Ornithinicoccus hortensis]
MKLHRCGPTAALAMAALLTLSACGDDNPTADNDASANEDAAQEPADGGSESGSDGAGDTAAAGGGAALSGTVSLSGASSQESAMTAWIAGYQAVQPDVRLNYDAIGSGGGRENLISGASPMIGSDAYLDEEEREAVKDSCGDGGALHIPVYISPVAIPYNLPGVEQLNLPPDVLAQIFDQQIETWNDPAIAEANPDADLPDTEITVVNRSDDSGTTENFTEYLVAAAPDAWPHEPSDAWPVEGGEAAAQTTGVISVVGSTEGAIGYADASAVGTLTTAAVGVGEEFVNFSPEAAAAVVDASEPVDTGVEGDLALDLARDTTESGTYPIVLVSYHIACTSYEDAQTGEVVKDFLTYVISEDGQAAAAEAAGSAPISDEVRAQATTAIEGITVGN